MALLQALRNQMMTYSGQSRFKWVSPSLLFATSLFIVAACATAPARPPAPISSGEPRVEPVTDPAILEAETGDIGAEEDAFGELGNLLADDVFAEEDGYTPPHMRGREVRRAAVLLPFSHPNPQVKADAESLLAGIEFAMFSRGEEGFVILPKDTAGVRSTARAKAIEALEEGADIIIGPLFSANIQIVREEAFTAEVPVIGFSARPEAAGDGAYLISLSPEQEVARVVETAAARGAYSYAFLGPNNTYGRRVETAYRQAVARHGGQMIASSFYEPDNDAPVDQAERLARAIQAEGERPEGEIAVLIPEQGVKLRAVAPLLPYYGVDIRRVQMLGTGRWNDPSVWREPTLAGGIFAAPDPVNIERFKESFTRIYTREPTNFASIGYDAGALASALAAIDQLNVDGVTNSDGFTGVNGLFRFQPDGTAERALSILQIDPEDGAVLVETGQESFDPPVGG